MLTNDSYRAINEALEMSIKQGFQIVKFNISKNITSSIFHLESNNIKNVFGYVSIDKVNGICGISVNIGYSMVNENREIYLSDYTSRIEYTRAGLEDTDTIYVLFIPDISSKTKAILLKHLEFSVFMETLRRLANGENKRTYADIYNWITKNPSFLDE